MGTRMSLFAAVTALALTGVGALVGDRLRDRYLRRDRPEGRTASPSAGRALVVAGALVGTCLGLPVFASLDAAGQHYQERTDQVRALVAAKYAFPVDANQDVPGPGQAVAIISGVKGVPSECTLRVVGGEPFIRCGTVQADLAAVGAPAPVKNAAGWARPRSLPAAVTPAPVGTPTR